MRKFLCFSLSPFLRLSVSPSSCPMQLSFSTTVTHKGRRYHLFFVGFFRLSLVAVFLFSTTVAYYHSLFAVFFLTVSPSHRFSVSPFLRFTVSHVPCPMSHYQLSRCPVVSLFRCPTTLSLNAASNNACSCANFLTCSLSVVILTA